jgi:23S rRNA pseudouridine2605 synthase
MRINKFIAAATGLSRRAADAAIAAGRVLINGQPAEPGQAVGPGDKIRFDRQALTGPTQLQTILLNKPAGYVVSREGQGSQTVYNLLPPGLHHLKPIGRLDKDSSGLLILTNDGQLAQQLAHPKYQKTKIYEAQLNRPLNSEALARLGQGVELEDGPSHLTVKPLTVPAVYQVSMQEGRNRQIRRTFAALGYTVKKLHRTHFGNYALPKDLKPGAIDITR